VVLDALEDMLTVCGIVCFSVFEQLCTLKKKKRTVNIPVDSFCQD
jgi:hypothetical protein